MWLSVQLSTQLTLHTRLAVYQGLNDTPSGAQQHSPTLCFSQHERNLSSSRLDSDSMSAVYIAALALD